MCQQLQEETNELLDKSTVYLAWLEFELTKLFCRPFRID